MKNGSVSLTVSLFHFSCKLYVHSTGKRKTSNKLKSKQFASSVNGTAEIADTNEIGHFLIFANETAKMLESKWKYKIQNRWNVDQTFSALTTDSLSQLRNKIVLIAN